MADANLPQCMTTVRLQELAKRLGGFMTTESNSYLSWQMLLDGTLGEQEVRALETNRRLEGQYHRLRSCDENFKAILTMGQPDDSQDDADKALPKSPQLLYAEYLYCASGALCEKPLKEWGACVKSLQTQKKEISECAQAKRLLERCLRGKTEDLLRAAQPQVFRPDATS